MPPKPFQIVWGFPRGYDPNLMGDACERCRRTDNWEGRAVPGRDFNAWSCRCTAGGQAVIPD